MIRLLAPYIIAAALGASSIGYIWHLRASVASLQSEVGHFRSEAKVAAQIASQAALSRDVARAEAERLRASAAEYASLREWVIRNDDAAPLPPLLRDALDRILRARAPR